MRIQTTTHSSAVPASAQHSTLEPPTDTDPPRDPSPFSQAERPVLLTIGSSAREVESVVAQDLLDPYHRDDSVGNVARRQHLEARNQRQSGHGPNRPAWLQYHIPQSLMPDVMRGCAAAHRLACKQAGLEGLSSAGNGAYKEDGQMKAVAIAKYVLSFRKENNETIPLHQTHSSKMAYYKNLSVQKQREFDLHAAREIEKLFSIDVRKEMARLRSGVGVGDGATRTEGINSTNEVRTVTNTSYNGNHGTRVGGQNSGVIRGPIDPSHGIFQCCYGNLQCRNATKCAHGSGSTISFII